MNPVFTALVPALHISWGPWWDSSSGSWGGGYGGYGGSYGSAGESWS